MTTPRFPDLFGNGLCEDNPIFDTDSYKYSHAGMFPKGTEIASATILARAGWEGLDEVVFFGLQFELARLAALRITPQMVAEAAPVLKAHGLDLYLEGWDRIATVHKGRLPVRIDALPEGAVVRPGVPQVRVENTDPALWWLPSFLETRLLRAVWYPSTVASLSRNALNTIRAARLRTDGTDAGVEFALHDFGARGASSYEAAAIGGAAHLVNAQGTDTVPALMALRNIYGADMAGYSIPATEHTIMTAEGIDGECAVMERILDAHPTGIVAMVSDSYDLMRAVREYWGKALRAKVLARDGTLVVRPDSGDPVAIVPDVIEALMGAFGATMTPKGYRLLPPQVRVIQGDGVNRFTIPLILEAMEARGLAAGNLAFGMGGGLLQKVTRDDFGYAMKTNALRVNGVWRDTFKDPVTAKGSKTSAKGRQGAFATGAGLVARRIETIPQGNDALRPVFEDGRLLDVQRIEAIRARAASGLATAASLGLERAADQAAA